MKYLALGLAVIGAAACGSPSLAYYRITPRNFCSSTSEVKLEWFTTADSVTLRGTPPIPGQGKKSGRGSVSLKPQAAEIHLDYGNKSDRPVLKLQPIQPGMSTIAGAPALSCRDGATVSEITFELEEYAPEVRVRSLVNRLNDREIVVSHLGREFRIPAGAEVPLIASDARDLTTRVGHAWLIRIPLTGSETCSSPRVRNPGVIMNLECAP
jgi:hypothetical protein